MPRCIPRSSTRILRRLWIGAGVAALLAFAAGLSGCRVNVNKDAHGQQKSVQVDTPFGGVHVKTDQITAADLGLPVYPGARLVAGKDNGQSADVQLGFGEWQMRVKAVNYTTPAAQNKVLAYYKNALERYGDVIECQGKSPIGNPAATSEGLSCSDDDNSHVIPGRQDDNSGNRAGGNQADHGLELKAGSKRNQHLVCFENQTPGQTRFSLIEIHLPADLGLKNAESD